MFLTFSFIIKGTSKKVLQLLMLMEPIQNKKDHSIKQNVNYGRCQKVKSVISPKNNIIFALKQLYCYFVFIPPRNLRATIGLATMDTSLHLNSSLIKAIKKEAISSRIFEAFLESAPQFILQWSIILRTGKMSNFNLASSSRSLYHWVGHFVHIFIPSC